jgi:hypothetical protein
MIDHENNGSVRDFFLRMQDDVGFGKVGKGLDGKPRRSIGEPVHWKKAPVAKIFLLGAMPH